MLNIIVSSPLFLWLLPLAGLPVFFHLFFKIRKKNIPFSSLMFFLMADPRMSARKRLRELLVLVLRVLALLLLMLALSRPVWLGGQGGGAVAQVLVIDNSASMSAPSDDGTPKLARALAAASVLLGAMGKVDRAALILTVNDPGAALPAGLSSERAVLRDALSRITATEAFGAPAGALDKAFALLAASSLPRREVHIFTDAQKNEWGKAALNMSAPPAGISIALHRIPSAPEKTANVAVSEIKLPGKRPVAGRNYAARIALKNTSGSDASVRLNIVGSSGAKASEVVAVPAGETKIVSAPVFADMPGPHWVDVRLENDGFAADNRAFMGFVADGRKNVLFLGGRSDFGLLAAAISPSDNGNLSGLVPIYTPRLDELEKTLVEKKPVMAVLSWHSLADRAFAAPDNPLAGFVAAGGMLLVLPDAGKYAPPETVPEWVGARPGTLQKKSAGASVIVFKKEAALWEDIRDEKGEVMIRDVKAFNFAPLTASADYTPLMGLEDGRVLLAERRLGKGAVFASGLAFDTRWSTLPLKGSFLAIVQSMALMQSAPSLDVTHLVAGAVPQAPPGWEHAVSLNSIEGRAMNWSGPAAELPAFPGVGFYLMQSTNFARYISVQASSAEGRAEFLDDSSAPLMGSIAHRVSTYSDAASFLKKVKAERKGVELLLPLLLAALFCVLAEGWLVNPVPGKAEPK